MPAKRYLVGLTPGERRDLAKLVSAGKRSARTIPRARILPKADPAEGGPGWGDGRIAEALGCGRRTVERVRQRLVEAGLDAALAHKPQARPSRSWTGRPRPGSSPWPARSPRTAGAGGPGGSRPTAWSSWRWQRPSPTGRSGAL